MDDFEPAPAPGRDTRPRFQSRVFAALSLTLVSLACARHGVSAMDLHIVAWHGSGLTFAVAALIETDGRVDFG